MLKYLHIENIAVIEKTDIDFSGGFNVLTGETGAGKSIIIDAINAVMGERTSKELIRSGCDYAEVSAVFGEINQHSLKKLEEASIFCDEDSNIIISRRLSLNGKGIIKVNGKPITASLLKEISKYLINIHGQHDNQALLNPENHCGFIDAIAENNSEISEYYSEFKKLNELRKSIAVLEMDDDEKLRKIDLLKYQINELESAKIKVGELESLNQRLSLVKNYEKTMVAVNEALFALKGDDNNEGALNLIKIATRALLGIDNKQILKTLEELSSASAILEGVSADVRSFADDLGDGTLDANEISDRLDLLHKLFLKYGQSEEKCIEFLENAKQELSKIEFADNEIERLSVLLDESTNRLIALAEKITNSRKKAAKLFEKQVCETLSYLNMPDVRFSVKIEQGRYTKNGCDVLEFLIGANLGEELKPLHKTASGGELSRVMLAIKSVLSDKDTVDTLIFDEIDSGISGYAAGKVANQLVKVANSRQVLCVTHLAQIAAVADNHLLIEKKTLNDRTVTSVLCLDYEERIKEIARIMSGKEMSENIYKSAKELLDKGKEKI